jgi:hypothetical protein
MQSIDSFNSFSPMEIPGSLVNLPMGCQTCKVLPFEVFPEDRDHPIRMKHALPTRWQKGPVDRFEGHADRGEYFAFQLGVYASNGDLENVRVTCSDLKAANGRKIPAGRISCINTDGVSYEGRPFRKEVNVTRGDVQAMWCGVDVPADAVPGTYRGTATVTANVTVPGAGNGAVSATGPGTTRGAAAVKTATVQVSITVTNRTAVEGGVGSPQKMTRLKWLNSTLAQENTVIAPYTPLEVVGDSLISLLGRRVQLNKQGFPEQIQSFFTPEMTEIGTQPVNLLGENIHFHFTRLADGKDIRLTSEGLRFLEKSTGTIRWTATSSAPELRMDVTGSLEFDGFMTYTVRVEALTDLDFKDIVMHIPFTPALAKYMMGLGQKGGYRPDSMYHWKWDTAHKNQDGAWIGSVNAGLQYSLRDDRYVRPLNTNFYLQKPLLNPVSWANGNKGGIDIGIKGRTMLANNYSGTRHMNKGDTLWYNFNLLITPFHPLQTDAQWSTRFYHRYGQLDSIKDAGATVINIHHATPINPWINYPFIEWKKMKGYIDSAHRLGLRVKIYNTIRELSNHAYETFALRSLGNEIYSSGPGGGYSWLQEHLQDDFIPGWFVPEIKDAAIINSGMNRWHNYYVEGMNWLVKYVGIDGIYLDDVAFDRVTMKRIKRVLTENGHPGIIDLHSANQYNVRDGFNNSANLYMEHFPYLNRLWFGEYFDYEKNPADFFLVEVSGIPFGLMGEMLEGGGNPWRGMIYGMTCRMPWTKNADPRPIWRAWDEFGMKGSKMIGYWSPNCPVRTGQDKIPATVYLHAARGAGGGAGAGGSAGNGTPSGGGWKALVSLASWADRDTTANLQIDWQRIGVDPDHAVIEAPAIENFQTGRTFGVGESIPVQKGKGWLLLIK